MSTEVTEQNKVIAEFMGGKYCEYPDKIFPDVFGYLFDDFNPTYSSKEKSCWWNQNALAFHSSWDWLMRVVEKIELLGYKFQICRKRVTIIEDTGVQLHVLTVKESKKIATVHKAVYDFIQWYQSSNTSK